MSSTKIPNMAATTAENAALSGELVLVTGGTGFVATYCIIELLKAGYNVRTTVRSLRKADKVRDILIAADAPRQHHLSFAEADLSSDAGWVEAVNGCKYVLHVASPFPPTNPKHERELIDPARDGTLRVLRAASAAQVKRVVVTSSIAAMNEGHTQMNRKITEEDWTQTDAPHCGMYAKSKALAERAAWDFIRNEGAASGMELSTVCPAMIYGPTLSKDISTSLLLVQKIMQRAMPGCPDIAFGAVDVRDVAALHLLAMTRAQASGQRYLAVSGTSISVQEMAIALQKEMPKQCARVPTRKLPNFAIRLATLWDPSVKLIVHELGVRQDMSGEKAIQDLGWNPRSNLEAIFSSATSLLQLGLVSTKA